MTGSRSERVREIDLGTIDPHLLHASYSVLAQVQAPDNPPLILWARSARPHISVGASQSAALEVDTEACERRGVPIIRRALGGGTVWVDDGQLCCFLVLPRDSAPRQSASLFDLVLDPAVRAMRQLGLQARRVGEQDIWVGERKIQGSGAATIDRSAVLGTSFLQRFDVHGFAELVRCPSEGFRQWLKEELMGGMSDWHREGIECTPDRIAEALRVDLEATHGWRIEPSALTLDERRGIADTQLESEDESLLGERRLVRFGIKINQRTYLLERVDGEITLRLVLQNDRLKRAYCSEPLVDRALHHLRGEPVESNRIREGLVSAGLTAKRAGDVAALLVEVCVDTRV